MDNSSSRRPDAARYTHGSNMCLGEIEAGFRIIARGTLEVSEESFDAVLAVEACFLP